MVRRLGSCSAETRVRRLADLLAEESALFGLAERGEITHAGAWQQVSTARSACEVEVGRSALDDLDAAFDLWFSEQPPMPDPRVSAW